MLDRAERHISVQFRHQEHEPLALAELWDEPRYRGELINRLQNETARLVEVAQQRHAAAQGKQLKRVTEVCKKCHDNLRKPEEKALRETRA